MIFLLRVCNIALNGAVWRSGRLNKTRKLLHWRGKEFGDEEV